VVIVMMIVAATASTVSVPRQWQLVFARAAVRTAVLAAAS